MFIHITHCYTHNTMYKFITLLLCILFPLYSNSQELSNFTEQTHNFLHKYVEKGNVDYRAILNNKQEIDNLIAFGKEIEPARLNTQAAKAFKINMYNLLVVQKIVHHYPVESVQDIPAFFTAKEHTIGDKKYSLNDIEKDLLRGGDARLHFALNCGAVSCPPLISFAYTPEKLDVQLDKVTQQALHNRAILYIENDKIFISQIFQWYAKDFGGEKKVKDWIAQYRENINTSNNVNYIPYNWNLNDSKKKSGTIQPYRASVILQNGQIEIKLFNSLYTQGEFAGFSTLHSRSTFFSSFTQFLYGINPKFNAGFDIVVKSNYLNARAGASPFQALQFKNADITDFAFRDINDAAITTTARFGLAHIGPKIKFNPISKWRNLSWQQTLYIPIDKAVDGRTISASQLFYDLPLNAKSQLFVEASLWTDIAPKLHASPFFKIFYSYFPVNKVTLYGMASPLYEYGMGAKYFLTPALEMEILGTWYAPIASYSDRRAYTLNFGLRYAP